MHDVPLEIRSLNSVNTKYHATPTEGPLTLEIRKNVKMTNLMGSRSGGEASLFARFCFCLLQRGCSPSLRGRVTVWTGGKNTTEELTIILMFSHMDHSVNDAIAD